MTPPPSLAELSSHAEALPSLPEVVSHLVRSLQDDNADVDTLAHHINADPTKHDMVRAAQIADLTAKIDEHRKQVAALIYASSQRWEIL